MSAQSANPSSPFIPASMTAVLARTYGGVDVLEIDEVPVPTPGEGEVLLAVAASSLNALDWHFVSGTPYLIRLVNGIRKPKRQILGADAAGTVAAVGSGVADFAVGDAVFGECEGGGCAPFVVVKETSVARKPDDVSFESAGATPVAGLTAIQALRTKADVQPGEHVLINGAAGGVGTFAVQLAKALGAEVTAVCSTGNVEMVRALGADTVIDYTVDDFTTGGARFDVMVDGVGNRSSKECLGLLRPDGRYVILSGPKTNRWLGPVPHIARKALAFKRASQTFHQFTASPNRSDLTFLGDLLASGSLKPEIQRTVGLDGVADGFVEIASGHAKAKIIVIPDR